MASLHGPVRPRTRVDGAAAAETSRGLQIGACKHAGARAGRTFAGGMSGQLRYGRVSLPESRGSYRTCLTQAETRSCGRGKSKARAYRRGRCRLGVSSLRGGGGQYVQSGPAFIWPHCTQRQRASGGGMSERSTRRVSIRIWYVVSTRSSTNTASTSATTIPTSTPRPCAAGVRKRNYPCRVRRRCM